MSGPTIELPSNQAIECGGINSPSATNFAGQCRVAVGPICDGARCYICGAGGGFRRVVKRAHNRVLSWRYHIAMADCACSSGGLYHPAAPQNELENHLGMRNPLVCETANGLSYAQNRSKVSAIVIARRWPCKALRRVFVFGRLTPCTGGMPTSRAKRFNGSILTSSASRVAMVLNADWNNRCGLWAKSHKRW